MKYDYPEPRVYYDESTGQIFNDQRVIRLALYYGWDVAKDDEAIKIADADESEITQDQAIMLPDITGDAIDYLNSLEDREGFHWDYEDGNFGLWEV